MVRRAALIGLLFGLAACTEQVVLYDVGDAGSPDLGAGKDGRFAPDGSCVPIWKTLNYSPQAADLIVVLDRSAAMQKPFAGTTREAAAQSALVNAIGMYQRRIKFGFEQFPADDTDPGCQTGTCCAGSVSYPTIANGAAMSSAIWCSDPRSGGCSSSNTDSPSHKALEKVRDYYYQPQSSTDEDRYVLLVTSSDPSCASDSHYVCDDALNVASDLGNAGVQLVVLAVGYQPDQGSCLYQVSQIGSSALPARTKPLYPTNNAYDLTNALTDFFSAVARSACVMTSNSLPPSQAQLMVSVDGPIGPISVPQVGSGSNQDGWSYSNSAHTSITFSGSACDDWVNSQLPKPDVGYACSSCDGPNACSNWQP